MKSATLMMLGIVITAAGLLFTLQGMGFVHWPPSSSMLGNRDWVERGIVVLLIGLALMLTGHRVRR